MLKYRDSRRRIWRTYGGETRYILIRRLHCPSCGRIHNELPDILAPHKHYGTEIVENVVDDVLTERDTLTEDYPCTATMRRWKDWIERNTSAMDGMLRSVGHRLLDFSEDLLLSSSSLLHALRSNGGGWLATVLRMLYNSGGSVPA